MFQRDIIEKLRKWADSDTRKPLVLRGARQVGKTSVVSLFAKEFDNYIYLNLEKEEDKSIFEHGHSIHNLIEAIYLLKQSPKKEGRTLLFIDEIQQSPKAVALLRYFYEEVPQLYVITAGSLLETLIDAYISFPVGRVEYMVIRPCSFSEYLKAIGDTEAYKLLNVIPFPEYGHEILLKKFNRYALVGGMPEVIQQISKGKTIAELSTIYETLIASYMEDVEKYARNNTLKSVIQHIIRHAFFSAGERISFYGFGQSQYKNREMGEAFRTLEKSFFLQLVYPVTNVILPIEPNIRRTPKLQLLDTGLVNFAAGLQNEVFNTPTLSDVFKGKIAEHITAQELLTLSSSVLYQINYWVREETDSMAEVDLVFLFNGMVIPIEVKSGKTGKLRSLHQFVDRAPHPYAVRIYSGKFSIQEETTLKGKSFKLLNLPFYLVNKLPEYLKLLVD